MTKHDAVTIATLISEWGLLLGEEIERLDNELPLEHQTKTDYRYISKEPMSIFTGLLPNKATRPDLYEPYDRPLPLAELDGLRAIVERMATFAEELRGNNDTTEQRD